MGAALHQSIQFGKRNVDRISVSHSQLDTLYAVPGTAFSQAPQGGCCWILGSIMTWVGAADAADDWPYLLSYSRGCLQFYVSQDFLPQAHVSLCLGALSSSRSMLDETGMHAQAQSSIAEGGMEQRYTFPNHLLRGHPKWGASAQCLLGSSAGSSPVAQSGHLLISIPFVDFLLFLILFPHFLSMFPGITFQILAPKSLSPSLLWGDPNEEPRLPPSNSTPWLDVSASV